MTSESNKNPSAYLFWNDIENDEHLATCSWGAKGLWACKLLPIAARSVDVGVIQIGNHPCRWDDDLPVVLARAAGATPEIIEAIATGFRTLLAELVTSGAASVDDLGRLFNRRMVREQRIRLARSAAGQKGAEGRWGTKCEVDGKHHGKRDGKTEEGSPSPTNGKQREIPGQPSETGCEGDGKSMPSSLLLDSKTPSNGESHTVERGPRAAGDAAPKPDPKGTRLPEGWRPEGALRQWTIDEIRNRESAVSAGHELQRFVDYWRAQPGAKGRKLDWDATWRNWIRKAIEMEGKPHGITNRSSRPQDRRSSALRVATNFAAVLSGNSGQRSEDLGRDGDAQWLDTADSSDPAGKARGGA